MAFDEDLLSAMLLRSRDVVDAEEEEESREGCLSFFLMLFLDANCSRICWVCFVFQNKAKV